MNCLGHPSIHSTLVEHQLCVNTMLSTGGVSEAYTVILERTFHERDAVRKYEGSRNASKTTQSDVSDVWAKGNVEEVIILN